MIIAGCCSPSMLATLVADVVAHDIAVARVPILASAYCNTVSRLGASFGIALHKS